MALVSAAAASANKKVADDAGKAFDAMKLAAASPNLDAYVGLRASYAFQGKPVDSTSAGMKKDEIEVKPLKKTFTRYALLMGENAALVSLYLDKNTGEWFGYFWDESNLRKEISESSELTENSWVPVVVNGNKMELTFYPDDPSSQEFQITFEKHRILVKKKEKATIFGIPVPMSAKKFEFSF